MIRRSATLVIVLVWSLLLGGCVPGKVAEPDPR